MRSSTKPRKRISFNQRQRLKFLRVMESFEHRALGIDFGEVDSASRAKARLENIRRRIRAITC